MINQSKKLTIFIAGASGAIGRPLVSRLLTDGHSVIGMTRSQERAAKLEKLGAKPMIGNALDETSVKGAIHCSKPDVVIEMLTSLPKEYTPQTMKEAAALNTQLRLKGGANLQSAAESTGVKRYILQSSAFWYAPGPGLATEETPFALDLSLPIAESAKVYAQQEKRVFGSKKLQGVALRFGFFYGPGTWYDKNGSMARQVQSGTYPIVGKGTGIWNFVHVDDAAKGISLALHASPGAYNLTDDIPLPQSVWLPAYARWLGAPPPLVRTVEEELESNGAISVYYATKLRGASNEKAKKELGFQPRTPEWINTNDIVKNNNDK